MDPAFSLADELADLHHHEHEEELEFHPHTYVGASLDDEYDVVGAGGSSLDAELEGLHLHQHELMGSLAAELDPDFAAAETFADPQSGSSSPPSHSLHRGGGVDSPPTGVPQLATTADISDTLEATEHFLARLGGGVDGEDAARLETAAAQFLKCVSQCSAEREEQLRELRELDRRLERDTAPGLSSSTSWHSDLTASTSTLPPDTPESPTTPTRHRRTTSSTSDATLHPPIFLDNTLFAPLYTSTSQLLGSLTSLHEHAQVSKSSTADAARKLKTVKGLIAQWHAEVDSVEQSERRIREAEADRAGSRGRQWVEEQVEWCQKRWDDAEGRARSLLTPVSIRT